MPIDTQYERERECVCVHCIQLDDLNGKMFTV